MLYAVYRPGFECSILIEVSVSIATVKIGKSYNGNAQTSFNCAIQMYAPIQGIVSRIYF